MDTNNNTVKINQIMKKNVVYASMGMLVISAFTVVSCSEDEELDDFYNLDISSRTPITKSTQADWESGASQTIGGTNPYAIPVNENECMLYALIKIASSQKIKINYVNNDGKEEHKEIGGKFSAEKAYNYVKSLATSQEWDPCDVYGNPIPDGDKYRYQGGAMAPSVAVEIGRESGILNGGYIHFSTFDDMQAHISSPEFQKDHPDGTYIICSEGSAHAAVGGLNRKGNVTYTDANNSSSTYKDSEKNGSWTLIF